LILYRRSVDHDHCETITHYAAQHAMQVPAGQRSHRQTQTAGVLKPAQGGAARVCIDQQYRQSKLGPCRAEEDRRPPLA
jgi:hypothetical protein